eukprot:4752120-Amphidinium_carterae.1
MMVRILFEGIDSLLKLVPPEIGGLKRQTFTSFVWSFERGFILMLLAKGMHAAIIEEINIGTSIPKSPCAHPPNTIPPFSITG